MALDASDEIYVLKLRNEWADRDECLRPAMWNGCWEIASQVGHACGDRAGPDHRGGSSQEIPITPTSPVGSRSSIWTRDSDHDWRSELSLWTQRHAAESRRNQSVTAIRESGRRPRSLRRDPDSLRACQRARARIRSSGSASEETSMMPDSSVQRFRGSAAARRRLEAVWQYWKHTLGAVHVETPDQSLNVLTNGWLLYQTLALPSVGAERILSIGRRLRVPRSTARFDGADPRRAASCARAPSSVPRPQFQEGDVQHWWHPPSGRACARTVPTITSGCPWQHAAMSLSTEIAGSWMNRSTLSKAARSIQEEDSYYDLPGRSEQRPVCTNTVCAPF